MRPGRQGLQRRLARLILLEHPAHQETVLARHLERLRKKRAYLGIIPIVLQEGTLPAYHLVSAASLSMKSLAINRLCQFAGLEPLSTALWIVSLAF
jgi:hypothetical protein